VVPVIAAHGVVKRFGRHTALAGIDLEVHSGRTTALLGPNGAGKTTFVRVVATLLRPDAGDLRVAGHDVLGRPEAVRRVIGLAGQYAAVEPAMTGRENLELIAQLRGQPRRTARAAAARLLERFGLGPVADHRVRTYSGGMRRKLDLSVSLVSTPRLLLLDEPTTGLDPRARLELWDAIDELVRLGTDVLLTTQYLDEAERLAGHIVIIDRGRVVAAGAPADLKRRVGANIIEIQVRELDELTALTEDFRRRGARCEVDAGARRLRVAVTDGDDLRVLVGGRRVPDDPRIQPVSVSIRPPHLDEVILALTGEPGRVHR
jgi:ABC-2 type transport system ATP-binding protein